MASNGFSIFSLIPLGKNKGGGGGGGAVDDVRVDNQSIVSNGVANTNTNQQAVNDLFNDMPDTDAITISDLLSDEDKSSEILTDNSQLSLTDLTNSKNKLFKLSQIWNYVKGKATEFIYPIGSVKFNDGSYNPQDVYGGTWSLYANGTKALYLDERAGTTINEELPNIKGEIQDVNFRGSSAQAITKSGALNKSVKSNGNAIGCGTPNGDVIKSIVFNASDSSAVYKDNGKVRADGITICAWIRTA